jgi:hypothetical protein
MGEWRMLLCKYCMCPFRVGGVSVGGSHSESLVWWGLGGWIEGDGRHDIGTLLNR